MKKSETILIIDSKEVIFETIIKSVGKKKITVYYNNLQFDKKELSNNKGWRILEPKEISNNIFQKRYELQSEIINHLRKNQIDILKIKEINKILGL